MRRRNLLVNTGGGGGTAEGHEYIEIGGVKWATTNIGAEKPTDYGLYFQWGDTNGYPSSACGANTVEYKKPFNWQDCVLHNGTTGSGATTFTKYNGNDGKTVLEPSDDAATLNWGGDWRMPTTAEFQALGAATTSAWTTVNGVYGLKVTDKTDSSKTLFFPAAGYCSSGSFSYGGSYGRYWSSSLYSSNVRYAYYMDFNSSGVGWQNYSSRYSGRSVRPVLGS